MESGGRRRNRVFDFVKKAYEMVDDPSTDSIVSWGPDGRSFIVWKPLECKRDLLTKLLKITSFGRFETYGFRKIVTGEEHLEFACNDFVRGKPELLDKIGERYVARMADPLHALRHAAMDLIETFIDNRIEQMQGYINGENNLHNLQNAINQLNMINNAIIDPALVAGDVAVEVLNAEELEEARDIARQSINETRNRIPGFINYINGENNMHNLQHAINNLNFINNQITNPALFAPPGN